MVGRVSACGEVQGDSANILWAPASGEPCVYYDVSIEEEVEITETDEDNADTNMKHKKEIFRL